MIAFLHPLSKKYLISGVVCEGNEVIETLSAGSETNVVVFTRRHRSHFPEQANDKLC